MVNTLKIQNMAEWLAESDRSLAYFKSMESHPEHPLKVHVLLGTRDDGRPVMCCGQRTKPENVVRITSSADIPADRRANTFACHSCVSQAPNRFEGIARKL